MNETISAIIAFSLPVIFHVLITYKVNMKVILVITGSLVGLSVLLANGFKSVFQHSGFVLNFAMKDDRFLIIVNGLSIGALTYAILKTKVYKYSVFVLGSRLRYWFFSLSLIVFLIK